MITIKQKSTGKVLYHIMSNSLEEADLHGADLFWADLHALDLTRANLGASQDPTTRLLVFASSREAKLLHISPTLLLSGFLV